ncbi:MAG: hydantoinase/oxoprolinase family protein [Desulfobacterales bacterium]|nr:hydantoinase/oxoprolinase family protein [Desulfobacterales bacterium]
MIIGLDVGGTHADVVLLGNEGLIKYIKVPTDPTDLFTTVLSGLEKITEGVKPERISRIVLSTTLTTNAIVQKKYSPVGMIVSSGPGIDPEVFCTNSHYYPASGSIDHRGREIEPIDQNQIKAIAEHLKEAGIQHVGVVCKFSVRNPDQELQISEILNKSFEKVFLGHQISGNLNFPRRIATTYFNAAVYPIHRKFFEAVRKSLEKKGLKVPIHILKADGGTMTFESSIDFPGQTILSGPAASVMGSIAFASDEEESLVLDIGGTTTDMAILINRVPLLNPMGIQLGPYKTLIRSLETHSIGIGGDSAVRVENGKLKIGPERKGHAMAYGGPVPTPTDALFAMGIMQEGDRERSVKGLNSIAAELGIGLRDVSAKIFNLACRKILAEAQGMINRINSKPVYTVHELQEGYTVCPKKMLVLGGPAPYFAKHLEKLSDFDVSVVPGWGVANAIGAALARTTCEVTLFADTERGFVTAPEEKFTERVNKDFSKKDAVDKAYELLKQKALQRGANLDDLEMEVLEELQFNMVRGFYTTGRNIRVKAQVKPGLIHKFNSVADWISSDSGRLCNSL